jgi:CRP/FNR family transcriptional regulator, cyclic AMP receptor protein
VVEFYRLGNDDSVHCDRHIGKRVVNDKVVMKSGSIGRRTPVTEWLNIFKPARNHETIEDVLCKIPVFGKLKEKELRHVGSIVHRRHYAAGERVFVEGDPGLGMYIVQHGEVSILFSGRGGEKNELAVLKEGEFFGEMALLDESPRSASAVTKTEADLIGFFRPDLFHIVDKSPATGVKIVLALAEVIGRRLRNTNQELSQVQAKFDELRSR